MSPNISEKNLVFTLKLKFYTFGALLNMLRLGKQYCRHFELHFKIFEEFERFRELAGKRGV